MRIKFTGNFRDLIPLGFYFKKMYAHNYRCYTTYNSEDVRNSPPHPLWIYQKERSVEIDDWGIHEVPILKYLEGKTFKNGMAKIYAVLNSDEIRDDIENTTKIAVRHIKGEISEQEMDKLVDKYYASYREMIVNVSALYKELDRIKGMYQIIEEA